MDLDETFNGFPGLPSTPKTTDSYSLVVRVRGLEYGGHEFESRSLHLKPEIKLHEERGLSGGRKGLKTLPLAQALMILKPTIFSI